MLDDKCSDFDINIQQQLENNSDRIVIELLIIKIIKFNNKVVKLVTFVISH